MSEDRLPHYSSSYVDRAFHNNRLFYSAGMLQNATSENRISQSFNSLFHHLEAQSVYCSAMPHIRTEIFT